MSGGVDDAATAAVMAELAVPMRDRIRTARSRCSSKPLTYCVVSGRNTRKPTRECSQIAAALEMKLGKPDAAQKYFDESVSLLRDLLGPRDTEVASLLVEISIVYLWKDDLAAAERAAREAVDILHSTLPKLHPDRMYAQAQLGEVLRLENHTDEASSSSKRL